MTARPTALAIGTRGSALALKQAETVRAQLREQNPQIEFVLRTISTRGDEVRDRPISEVGDKGIFIRTLERALLAGEIDIAVHSLKDVPSDTETDGLVIAAFSAREDPRDVIVGRHGADLHDLPSGAVVGTGSARRRVQLLALRPDLQMRDIRGNVDTRLNKLRAGEFDAIVLAAAGLNRLGLAPVATRYLSVEECIPDAGQGILAIQTRCAEFATVVASRIDDPAGRLAAITERAVVRGLQADCHSPVGAYAAIEPGALVLYAMAAHEDGSSLQRRLYRLAPGEAVERGLAVGRELLQSLARH